MGNSPGYRAFHEVYVTKGFGAERNGALVASINKHIIDFKGKTEDKHGIPQMLFERVKMLRSSLMNFMPNSTFPKNILPLRPGNIPANILNLNQICEFSAHCMTGYCPASGNGLTGKVSVTIIAIAPVSYIRAGIKLPRRASYQPC